MAEIAIITANYGGYDTLKAALPQQDMDVDWVVVTDMPILAVNRGWRAVYRAAPEGVSNFRAAKHPKLFPWMYTDAPMSIWIDGSVIVSSPNFARDVAKILETSDLAQFDHPEVCIYCEAMTSLKLLKYKNEFQLIKDQCKFYRQKGHPDNWGLWATTVIARKHTPLMRSLSYQWDTQILRWSSQDQISQPYILRNLDLKPALLGDSIFTTHWFNYAPSANHFNPPGVEVDYGFWEDLRS